ncbi:uncharacterized protein LOC114033573 [Vombatus ursinus]|uniref:uncharacterized protein LOC114033573 n=1 Tax=Vombatus ursinus TaxID=29139 RepID=UPI000FFDB618|nr:uncharacterized protein LOC114033573 [Vombatus ursinus]
MGAEWEGNHRNHRSGVQTHTNTHNHDTVLKLQRKRDSSADSQQKFGQQGKLAGHAQRRPGQTRAAVLSSDAARRGAGQGGREASGGVWRGATRRGSRGPPGRVARGWGRRGIRRKRGQAGGRLAPHASGFSRGFSTLELVKRPERKKWKRRRSLSSEQSVARRCACVAERGSEAVSSAPFPAVAGAELGGGRGGGGGSSSVGRGTLHTGRWPEVARQVPPGINDLTRSRNRRCRSGVEGRWFGGRAGRGLRRRRGQERQQAVRGAARAGAAALGAWGGRAVPGWASPGRRLPAAQLVAGGGDRRKPVLGQVMSA